VQVLHQLEQILLIEVWFDQALAPAWSVKRRPQPPFFECVELQLQVLVGG
jgi:hypothetical protein